MRFVIENPELVQRMIDDGHIIGNHTVNHYILSDLDEVEIENEIMGLHNYVKEKFNYEMKYLRPPEGNFDEKTVKIAKKLGYRTVLWSLSYRDWDIENQYTMRYSRNFILENIHNGAVVLLHAVSKNNADLLGEIIDEMRIRGYEFKTLDEFEE